jgi:PII-like signaling protein
VNITGSFAVGFFAGFTDPQGLILVSPRFREFFMIGLCGGYTTFSSFSLQTLELARDGLVKSVMEHTVVGRMLPHSRMGGAYPCSRRSIKIKDAVVLRIFVGESDRHGHQPLYQAIVLKAREMQMAGATVLRGPMGFGKSSHLHTAKILRLSMDLPIVIEIVDSEEKVNAFLPVLDGLMGSGLVTLERAKVIRYQDQQKN